MSIFKDTLKKELQDQLKVRQDALVERTPTAIQYYNARNAWVRMSSAVNVLGSNELASQYVLQGGVLFNGNTARVGVGTGNQAYSVINPSERTSNRLGLRPMPGITGIDIKSKSAYGSLRQVTVSFVAWDIRQLEDLELLYMRPGYTVLVEWGWAPYLTNEKKLSNNVNYYDIINQTPTKEQIFKDLYDNAVKEYDGNYDAMFGYVKNYSWSARDDGGYDCTTEIISVGEVMESLKVNYAPLNGLTNILGAGGLIASKLAVELDEEDLKLYYSKNVLAGLFYELYEIGKKKTDEGILSEEAARNIGIIASFGIGGPLMGAILYAASSPRAIDEGKNYTFIDKDKNGKKLYYDFYRKTLNVAGGAAEANSDGKIGASDEQVYITLETLCNVINTYVTFTDSNSKEAFVKCSVLDRDYLASGSVPDPLTGDGYLLCLAHPLQLSVDPTICVIKSPVWTNGFKVNPDTLLPTTSEGKNLVRYTNDDEKIYTDLIAIIKKEIKSYDTNEENLIREMSSVLKGDTNKIKELSRIWYETSAGAVTTYGQKLNLYDYLDSGLTTSELYKALGTAESEKFLDILKKSPIVAEQDELNKKKKELESTQTKAIEGLQYLNNISRSYFYQSDWTKELGVIGNIYVNLNYLFRLALDNNLESLDTKEKKDINLYNFLKSVLSEISSATGNVNNFDLYVDPIDSKIYFIDINYVDFKKREEVYSDIFQLEMHNLKSTVRSYKLESQIFPDQSTTVAIGAQVGGGAMATDNNTMLDFNRGLSDRIIPKKEDPTIDPNQQEAEKTESQFQSVINSLQSLYDFFGDQRYSAVTDANFDADKVGDYKNSLKDLINFFKNLTNSDIKNRAIIPTKLSFVMDGLGGLIIGHLFKIPEELLPRGYQGGILGSKLGYTITGIGHTVKDNDWTTNVDAQTIILDKPTGSTLKFSDLVNVNPKGNVETKAKEDINKTRRTSTGGATKTICGQVRTNGNIEDILINMKVNLYKRHYSSVNQSDEKRIRLQPNAMRDLEALLTDAYNAGIYIKVNSAYRTREDQERIKKDSASTGIPAATPGTSNHGFGLAVDLADKNGVRINPSKTPKEWTWVQANKAKYGFENLNNGNESHHYNYTKPGLTC